METLESMLPTFGSTKIADRSEAASFYRSIYNLDFDPEEKGDMIKFARTSSLVEDLVKCLKEGEAMENTKMQVDASRVLIFLTLDEEFAPDIVLKSGAINALCSLADQESNSELRVQVLLMLGYLADNVSILYAGNRDGERCRRAFLESGCLDVILRSIQYDIQKEESDTENQASLLAKGQDQECNAPIPAAFYALRNLVTGPPEISLEQMRGFAPCIVYVIRKFGNILSNVPESSELVLFAFDILDSLVEDGTPLEVAKLVQDNGDLCPILVSLLYGSNASFVNQVFQTLDSIYSKFPQAVMDSGILSNYCYILQTTALPMQRKTAWTMLNRFTKTQSFIQAVVDNEELAFVIVVSLENSDQETQGMAVRLMHSLATKGTDEQTKRLVNLGILEALCSCWHEIKADMDFGQTGKQCYILGAIETCLVRAENHYRRVYCNVLDMFLIREILDHAASGSDPLSARAKRFKDDFFSHPLVVETEGEGFVEFQFFPRKKH